MVTEPERLIWPGLRRALNWLSAVSYWVAVVSSMWRVPQWSRCCAANDLIAVFCAAASLVRLCSARAWLSAGRAQTSARPSTRSARDTDNFLFILNLRAFASDLPTD